MLHRHTGQHTDDSVIKNFPKISDHFSNISEDSPKFLRRPDERCRAFSENNRILDFRLPKTLELRGSKDVLIIHKRIYKYNLKLEFDISEIIDIFNNENMENAPPDSRMLFRMNFNYEWCISYLFNKFTSIFHALVLLLMINCVITVSKWLFHSKLCQCYDPIYRQ